MLVLKLTTVADEKVTMKSLLVQAGLVQISPYSALATEPPNTVKQTVAKKASLTFLPKNL